MKVNYLTLLAGATLVLLSAAATRAEESAASALATEANAAPATTPSPATAPSPTMASNGPAPCVLGDTATYYEDSDPVQDFMLRAGAWAVHSSGSPTQVGQYENVRQSSGFFDLEGMMSNCDHSLDMSLQGNDNDTDDARVHYFGPAVEANVVYQRFDHQLYQNSYAGWVTVPAASSGSNANFNVASRDNFNPGQDYAMHVQDFKADFHGNLTDNLKWYVNTFGMEKTGERQANAVAMCLTVPASHPPIPYTNGTNTTDQCHAVSQVQHIDWQTTEVEAGLELRLGAVTVNYSHMYRDFQAFDQQVSSVYPYNSHSGPNSPLGEGFQTTGGTLYSLAGYDIVPNTVTQMDRIKAHAELGCATDAYVLGYLGDTGDELNQMNRHYTGGDLRITNKSIENLTLTGYGRAYTEHTNAQGLALGGGTITSDSLYASPPPLYSQQQYYQQTPWYPNPLSYLPAAASTANAAPPPPLDRDREAVGFSARWLPFGDDCDFVRRHLAVVGGYEYSTEHYQNTGGTADYEYPGVASFNQPDTDKNTFSIGVEEKWSNCFNTYVRYKWIGTHYPFLGFSPAVDTAAAEVNTALPTEENRVEIGGTWTTCDCLMLNAVVYLEMASNNGPYHVDWDSNSFPFVLSAWWSPTSQWSFNAGFAEMDSWINQDVWQSALASANPPAVSIPATFNNRSDVVNLGTRYAWTPRFSTCASFEYVHAVNDTSIPVLHPTAGAAPYDLGGYSLVRSETYRLTLGADYLLRPGFSTFARYNYYNFQDLTPIPVTGGTSSATNTNTSGQTNMFLVGASAKF